MSLPKELRDILINETTKLIAPEGLNANNSKVCCSCGERKHVYYMCSIVVGKKGPYVFIPFGIKSKVGPGDTIEVRTDHSDLGMPPESICGECFRFAVTCVVEVATQGSERNREKIIELLEEKERDRVRRN